MFLITKVLPIIPNIFLYCAWKFVPCLHMEHGDETLHGHILCVGPLWELENSQPPWYFSFCWGNCCEQLYCQIPCLMSLNCPSQITIGCSSPLLSEVENSSVLIAFSLFSVFWKKISPVRTEICEFSRVTTILYLDKLITAVVIKCHFSNIAEAELGLTVPLQTVCWWHWCWIVYGNTESWIPNLSKIK